MTRKLQACVSFARFCAEYNIAPTDLAELLRLKARAFRAGERHCNMGTGASHARKLATATQFENFAKRFGFTISWPGLCPVLRNKGGYDVYLPEC